MFGNKTKRIQRLEEESRMYQKEAEYLRTELAQAEKERDLYRNPPSVLNLIHCHLGTDTIVLAHQLENDRITKLELRAEMKSGDVDECFVGLWYGVSVVGWDEKGEEKHYGKVKVNDGGDGYIYSQIACERRFHAFSATKLISNYLAAELGMYAQRYRHNLKIVQTEKPINNLLVYKPDDMGDC